VSFNILIALIGSLGMYMIFLGLYTYVTVSLRESPGGLLYGPEDEELPRAERISGSLLASLDQMLYQARIPVRAGEFLLVSLILGVAVGGVMFFATGAVAAVVIGFTSGLFLYYIYLDSRRSRLLDEYEAAMPHALRDMRAAFLAKGLSPGEALRYVSEQGPEACRSDFEELAATFHESRIDYSRLHRLLGLRGSYALDRVSEALLQFQNMPQRIPEILDLLIPRLRKEVRIRREMRANISNPRRQLVIVALMPFLVVLFFRAVAPEYARFYAQPIGQLILILAFLIDVAVYLGASAIVRRTVNPIPYRRLVPERRRSAAPSPAELASSAAADRGGGVAGGPAS
jgi:Flp pilus assembly protein TadB